MRIAASLAIVFALLVLLSCSEKDSPPTFNKGGTQSSKKVGPQCHDMGKTVSVAELVNQYGQPDSIANGAPPLQWWAYKGSDGTCLLAVDGDEVDQQTNFIPK